MDSESKFRSLVSQFGDGQLVFSDYHAFLLLLNQVFLTDFSNFSCEEYPLPNLIRDSLGDKLHSFSHSKELEVKGKKYLIKIQLKHFQILNNTITLVT
mmetsp:Transcript_1856/g.3240  ORF Transcript_1856/g.3240 Transcript_1856/m.3240 type:complete len:98 (-) Transcript_1856:562-855(-)